MIGFLKVVQKIG